MVQQIQTKLSIFEWARIMGVNPTHFGGVYLEELQRECGGAWLQYGWQDAQRLGREDIAQAIADAEADLEALIGYRLLPTWEQDEWRATTRHFRREAFNLNNRDIRGQGSPVELRWGYLIAGGIRQAVAIQESAAIAYSNTALPAAYLDTATVTVTLSQAIAPEEVCVYYPGHGGDERYRIKPITVTTVNGVYTITFLRAQALNLDIIESQDLANLRAVDGKDDANFLTACDVYRVYNDPQQQATMLWEPFGGNCLSCNGGGCSACGYATQSACLVLREDPRLSIAVAHPATWNQTNLAFDYASLVQGGQPDLIRFWYYAGWRDKSLTAPLVEMDRDWASIVAHLATSKLDHPPCECSGITAMWKYWADDLAFTRGAAEIASYSMSAADLDNPLGTRRGAVAAYKRTMRPGATIGRLAAER